MKKKLFLSMVVAMLALAFVGFYSTPANAIYQEISETSTYDSTTGLVKVETVVQFGCKEINRFVMGRVVKADSQGQPLPATQLKGAFILLPPGGSNSAVYDIASPDSLVNFLALNGVDVYTYSPRTTLLVPGDCAVKDCSPMKRWGISTYINDIDYVSLKAFLYHFKRPVLGGLSLGGVLAIAAANRTPWAFEGLVLWESTLYYGPPSQSYYEGQPLQNHYQQGCADLKTLVESGTYFDEETYPGLQYIFFLADIDPEGDSPFYPGLTNMQFFVVAVTTPGNPPEAEAPGYTTLAGDLFTGLYYANWDYIRQFLLFGLNYYEPTALQRDYTCGFAGERTFTQNLGLYYGPILSLQSGNGFGTYAEDNLALFSNADVTRNLKLGYGHVEHSTHFDQYEELQEPLWQWMEQKVLPNW
jgi:pimeloyl-ACP methyl ester carboxylesterase